MKYGTLMYIKTDKGILMLNKYERKDDPNSEYSVLPGGKLDPCEKGLKNIEGRLESTVRETEAETGIIPLDPILRGTIIFDNKDRTFPNWPNHDDFYVYLLSATEYKGELKKSDEGVPFWALEENIPSLPKNKGDKLMYEWLMSNNLKQGKNFVGVIKHNGYELDKENSWVDWM